MKDAQYWIDEYEKIENEEFIKSVKSKITKKKKEVFHQEIFKQKKIEQRFEPKENNEDN